MEGGHLDAFPRFGLDALSELVDRGIGERKSQYVFGLRFSREEELLDQADRGGGLAGSGAGDDEPAFDVAGDGGELLTVEVAAFERVDFGAYGVGEREGEVVVVAEDDRGVIQGGDPSDIVFQGFVSQADPEKELFRTFHGPFANFRIIIDYGRDVAGFDEPI